MRQSHGSQNVVCSCKIGAGLGSQLVNYLSMLFLVAKRRMKACMSKKGGESRTQVINWTSNTDKSVIKTVYPVLVSS